MATGKITNSVETIEQKPHKRYIRYLLSKKISPSKIKKDLAKFGLSSPHEDMLVKYYFAFIEPLVKKNRLGHVYQDYKDNLLKTGIKAHSYRDPMRFKIQFQDNIEDQVNFLKFCADAEIMDIWQAEMYTFYGKRENVPTDPATGLCLMPNFQKISRLPWNIVDSPYRHVIDEMLLEGFPGNRIIEYMNKTYDMKIFPYDISLYSKIFFNIEMFDVSSQVRTLELERNNLLYHLENVEKDIGRANKGQYDGEEMMSDLMNQKKQLQLRIHDLGQSIKVLQSTFSESAARAAEAEKNDFQHMFETMMQETYKRFGDLSKFKDRDVVDPLFKLTKMMGTTYELYNSAKENSKIGADKYVQTEMIQLVHKRESEQADEEIRKRKEFEEHNEANKLHSDSELDINNIEGVDEVLTGFTGEEEGEKNE